MSQKPNFGIVALALAVSPFAASQAATLQLDAIQRYDTARTDSADLTATGTTDWAVWEVRRATSANFAPTTSKTSGTAIGNVTNIGGTTMRGTSNAGNVATGRYTWTGADASSGVARTDYTLNGSLLFNDAALTANTRENAGFSVSIQGGLTGVPNYLVLYLGGFLATGNLQVTLNGATTLLDTSVVFAAVNPKQTVAYQLIYTPDNANDVLTVNYPATGTSSTQNSHVGIEAISLGLTSVIPEPGSVLLGALGATLLLGRRQRR